MTENLDFLMKFIQIFLAIAAIAIFGFVLNAEALQLPKCALTDCNCSDFQTQQEAQAVFDLFRKDVFSLDRNRDGLVCTSLPSNDTPTQNVKTEIVVTPLSSVCNVVPNSVYDGDTMRVNCRGRELKIRFACIDAPEKAQDYGIEARDYLRSLLSEAGERVQVLPVTTDRYDRTVAALYIDRAAGWEFLQELQVLGGTAWGYEQYSDTCIDWAAIVSAQIQAKAERKGLWENPDSIPPWEWRRENR